MTRQPLINIFNSINLVMPSSRFFKVRVIYLRLCGLQLASNIRINNAVRFYSDNVIIGDNTWIGPECSFYSNIGASISIGNNCDIAPRVAFITGSHAVGNVDHRAGVGIVTPIVIGNGCWLGACSVILGGALIDSGSIVAAGALVLPGKYPKNSLLAGVPAIIKKTYN